MLILHLQKNVEVKYSSEKKMIKVGICDHFVASVNNGKNILYKSEIKVNFHVNTPSPSKEKWLVPNYKLLYSCMVYISIEYMNINKKNINSINR